MIHTVETAGAVDPSWAETACIVGLSWFIINIVAWDLFLFFRVWVGGDGGRLETIEESEVD